MERVALFIDGSNFYHGLKANLGRTRVDFYKFATLLCGENRKLIRIYYYNAPHKKEIDEEKYKSQQKFFSLLERTPYLELKLGRLEPRGDTFIEKGVDILLAVDMLKYAYDDTYDTAILVSGDGDFAAAVNAVKDRGKHVEHAYFKDAPSVALRKACDKYIPLDNDFISPCFI
ncbi:MAG: NYN domain-containing protein [Methanophagales archaeon]|nr:NYN domain-containing protein [Methanophagales archaeon]MCW3140959.1 NYN domain-containing protein [Methanophagales archaeon]